MKLQEVPTSKIIKSMGISASAVFLCIFILVAIRTFLPNLEVGAIETAFLTGTLAVVSSIMQNAYKKD